MASTGIDATALFVRTLADVAIQNEKYFADLDGVCGDGDFGISLATGFSKVVEQWDAIDRSTPGALLKGVAMAIASSVGGVSGAIWGPRSCARAWQRDQRPNSAPLTSWR